jgi:iron complex outermembrane receptor protein
MEMKLEGAYGFAACRGRWIAGRASLGVAMALLSVIPARSQQNKETDLAEKSLEDLMNTEVTSVSKKEQKLSQVAAAIFVITQEDIRRSGATNIPDLLRMVPGMEVAQIDGNTWAISARGFNTQFANKLLVLVDGRTVYSALAGGVFWDTLDLLLEDIDRIEVIRGPGATVWGANAVNGVINIIPKKSSDTQEGLIAGGAGDFERGFAEGRYGGKLGQQVTYRAFMKYFSRNHLLEVNGQSGDDGWDVLRGGFRADATLNTQNSLTLEGGLYTGTEGETRTSFVSLAPVLQQTQDVHAHVSGGDILGRWNHVFSSRSDTTLQLYDDRYSRNDSQLRERQNTVDLDFQHHLAWGRQDFVWGAGYRFTADDIAGSLTQSFVPGRRNANLFNSFVQDEITVVPEKFFLTIGSKLEHNTYTGFHPEPSLRWVWTPDSRQAIWGAYSRATSTPSRAETALHIVLAAFPGPGGSLTLLELLGNPRFKDENVDAYELGYRVQASSHLSLDLATFYNKYRDLNSTEPGTPFFETNPAPPHLVIPLMFGNGMLGKVDGVELAANWKPWNHWTLSPGYTLLQMHLHRGPSSQDTDSPVSDQGLNPRNQFQLRSHLDFPRHFEVDTSLYFVGRLPTKNVPSYTRVDQRFAWLPAERLEISLVGQNLAQDHHSELVDPNGTLAPNEVKSSFYGEIRWRF